MEEKIAMQKSFKTFVHQPDTNEEMEFIMNIAPDREWDQELRGFLAGWNAAKAWIASNK